MYSSVVDRKLSMSKALGSLPSNQNKRHKIQFAAQQF